MESRKGIDNSMNDLQVKIEYRNKNLETVVEKEYDFAQYTEMLNLELMRLLMEIEDGFYYCCDYKQKEEWPPAILERFKKIRHKMLDNANAIKRLPDNLYVRGVRANQMTIGDFLNSLKLEL